MPWIKLVSIFFNYYFTFDHFNGTSKRSTIQVLNGKFSIHVKFNIFLPLIWCLYSFPTLKYTYVHPFKQCSGYFLQFVLHDQTTLYTLHRLIGSELVRASVCPRSAMGTGNHPPGVAYGWARWCGGGLDHLESLLACHNRNERITRGEREKRGFQVREGYRKGKGPTVVRPGVFLASPSVPSRDEFFFFLFLFSVMRSF